MRAAFLCAVILGWSGGPAAAELSPRAIFKSAAPAVVLIMGLGADGKGELGTGSFIHESGKVLTNAHVVVNAATKRPYEKIRVYFKPAKVSGDPRKDLQSPVEARVGAFDRELDLAVLELAESPSGVPVLPLGSDEGIEAGEPVVAIGHPEQGGLWTLTTGVVSTVLSSLGGVKGKDVFQTDASINRGNSGGPLINRQGAMIGVNTSMARKAPDGLTITSVNFSVRSGVVKRWLASVPVSYVEAGAPSAASEPAPAAEPAPQAPKPAKRQPKKETAAPAEEKPAAPAPQAAIVTPKKPFKIDDVIGREMAEMDDLEAEMLQEIDKRRADLAPASENK